MPRRTTPMPRSAALSARSGSRSARTRSQLLKRTRISSGRTVTGPVSVMRWIFPASTARSRRSSPTKTTARSDDFASVGAIAIGVHQMSGFPPSRCDTPIAPQIVIRIPTKRSGGRARPGARTDGTAPPRNSAAAARRSSASPYRRWTSGRSEPPSTTSIPPHSTNGYQIAYGWAENSVATPKTASPAPSAHEAHQRGRITRLPIPFGASQPVMPPRMPKKPPSTPRSAPLQPPNALGSSNQAATISCLLRLNALPVQLQHDPRGPRRDLALLDEVREKLGHRIHRPGGEGAAKALDHPVEPPPDRRVADAVDPGQLLQRPRCEDQALDQVEVRRRRPDSSRVLEPWIVFGYRSHPLDGDARLA